MKFIPGGGTKPEQARTRCNLEKFAVEVGRSQDEALLMAAPAGIPGSRGVPGTWSDP